MTLDTRVAQGREYGHEICHHRVIGRLVDCHTSQALVQAVTNGRGHACGAICCKRRCQLDQDVVEHIQPHRDRVKIA